MNIENNYNKVYIAKNYIKYRVYWCAHFIFITFMIDGINYWVLDKNYAFFGHLFLHGFYDGNG